MRVVTLSALLAVATTACVDTEVEPTPQPTLISEDNPDDPLAGLSTELQQAFNDGDAAFEARMFSAQGLGPLYVRVVPRQRRQGPGLCAKDGRV